MKPYYEHAGITIYNCDCREILPSLSADLLLADPPYGLGAARRSFGANGVKRHMTGLVAGKVIAPRDYGDSAWDDEPCPLDLLKLAMSRCPLQIIWGGNYFDFGIARCWLVWDKLRGDTDYADGELAWTNLDRAVRIIRWRWNGFLQQNSGDKKEERYHPTQKPFSVMAWAIKQAPQSVQSLLDPFMGVGSSLIAAKALGITGIGIEICERYCEIAAKRLSQEIFSFEAAAQ